jgi:hypothetical protein
MCPCHASSLRCEQDAFRLTIGLTVRLIPYGERPFDRCVCDLVRRDERIVMMT